MGLKKFIKELNKLVKGKKKKVNLKKAAEGIEEEIKKYCREENKNYLYFKNGKWNEYKWQNGKWNKLK